MRKPTRAGQPLFAYVGSYTTPERNGEGDGINVYRVDRRTGAFTHLQRLGGLENPSFLAVNAAGTRLYSVHGDRSEINAFTIDPRTGQLAPLNRQPTGGYNPVHLAFDATGRFLAVCNYGTDSLAVFPLADDGSLLPYRTLTTVTGTLGRIASSSAPCACTTSRSTPKAASSTCRAKGPTPSSPIASTQGARSWSRPRA